MAFLPQLLAVAEGQL